MTATPHHAVWLSEPSSAAVEMAGLAGFDTVVLDVEHGSFDLGALDWMLPFIRARSMQAIVKVLGPERGPIQQALGLGAAAVVIPHVESAAHAAEVTAFAKFPPLGLRSFAGGRTSAYRGFTNDWVAEQDNTTRCYPMIEDASAFSEVQEILALPTVDGVFIGPSDLSLLRGRGAYTAGDADFSDLRAIARAARAAGKPWILPAWSDAEKRLALQEGAHTIVGVMQYGAMFSGFGAALDTIRAIEAEEWAS